jgi:perosamine synthetase
MIPYGKHSISWLDIYKVAMQLRFHSLTQGKRIDEFEKAFAAKVGASYAVSVSSATAGLHISLLALNLPKGSIVATSPISFVASSNAALYSGLEPLFIDVSRESKNIDVKKLELELDLNPNISAVIPVHYSGLPCEMSEINQISQKRKVRIIEDAAHALGASYVTGEPVGCCKYSDITVFSMHPVKSVTTGEGGMITTNSNSIYRQLLRLRSHGINKMDDSFLSPLHSKTGEVDNLWYYEMQELGFHYRLTEIQAALGISQLKRLDQFIAKRKKIAKFYFDSFKDHKIFNIPKQFNLNQSSHHLFTIQIDFSKTEKNKNQIMLELREAGIVTQVHYMPIPLHPYYASLGYSVENIPEAMDFYYSTLSIPIFPNLSRRKMKRIVKTINKVLI